MWHAVPTRNVAAIFIFNSETPLSVNPVSELTGKKFKKPVSLTLRVRLPFNFMTKHTVMTVWFFRYGPLWIRRPGFLQRGATMSLPNPVCSLLSSLAK